MRILCFDIGGTAIKAQLCDESARAIGDRIRILTPRRATPKAVFAIIEAIAAEHAPFSRVAAGFPGVVKDGIAVTAPNLNRAWHGFDLRRALEKQLGVAARVANDADVQGLGASRGRGLELMITLGTGVGSALINDGILIPNLEMGHHPFRHGETYEEQLGKTALAQIGKRRWNQRVRKMVLQLSHAFNFHMLYIGGGNAKLVRVKLPENVQLISNESGLLGCVRLWYPATVIPVRRIRLVA